MRITEVAQVTGFRPTTLRYYEKVGILTPPERTEAGYRAYDRRDVERLRLIGRAKDLGCTLEEIGGLVRAWDAGDCGPVKNRLRALVDARVDALQRQIAEQADFATRLRAASAGLADRPVDGPCDDTCGCTAPTGTETTPRPETIISCSLGGDEIASRVDEWRTLLVEVERRESIPGGIRLCFRPATPLTDVARLVAAEHGCCAFFAFSITVDARGVALEVTAPDEAQGVVQALFGATGRSGGVHTPPLEWSR